MALTVETIMTDGGQNLPFARDLREAVALYARRTWPLNTSGQAAKAWRIDKSTAANLLKGHASDATITRVLRAGGWRMASAVVGAVIGQSIEDHLDLELEAIRAERSRLDELEERARLRWAALCVARADPGLDPAEPRSASRKVG
jgi:hypothetical protein